jgi:MFS family permease
MALSAMGLAAIAVQAPILPALVALGLALGLQTGPLMAVAVASVEPERSGMASGLINVARLLGATMGVAVLGSVFASASGGAATPEQFSAGMRTALLVGALAELVGCLTALATIGQSALHRHPQPARRVVRGNA